MQPEERLSEVFDRGLAQGVQSLQPDERELYLIQDFIIEYEMNGLSGYFYNRLPDTQLIASTVAAMRRYALTALAAELQESLNLFRGYADPDPPTTWSEVLRQYDPEDRLHTIAERISALKGYGLSESSIS